MKGLAVNCIVRFLDYTRTSFELCDWQFHIYQINDMVYSIQSYTEQVKLKEYRNSNMNIEKITELLGE